MAYISKFATKIAAKNDKNSLYIVSSIFKMPFCDNVFDIILNIFAPKPEKEFRRILKDSGIIIEVIPGENHMLELRRTLYDEEQSRSQKIKEFDGFSKNAIELTYKKVVESGEDIENLLKMTPYWYKTSKDSLLKIKNIEKMQVTFDFVINIFRRS